MRTSLAPQQERSIQSLARLLDATERLLKDHDFDDISVDAIAREAGTSVGNFYGRFASKAALLEALHERYEEDRAATWRSFLQDPTLNAMTLMQRTRALLGMVVKNYRNRSGVFRTLVMRQWRDPHHLSPRNRALLSGLYDSAREQLLQHRHEIRHPNPVRAVEIGIATIAAACRETIVMRPKRMPASLAVSDEELIEELSQMLVAYLTTPPQRSA